MNTDEMITYNDRVYVNPDISRDEQMAFVDTLRDLQAQKNAQIATETHNLGTDVEPHLGGLSGSEGYWQGKYQTPQTEALVANMKAVAQQSALNTALKNYQDALKERYNQAYRAYQKRAYNRNNVAIGGGDDDDDAPSFTPSDKKVGSVEPAYSPLGSGNFDFEPNIQSGNSLPGGVINLQNNLIPNTEVNIQRDKYGNITSLTYNGKTFSGESANKEYERLQKIGSLKSQRK